MNRDCAHHLSSLGLPSFLPLPVVHTYIHKTLTYPSIPYVIFRRTRVQKACKAACITWRMATYYMNCGWAHLALHVSVPDAAEGKWNDALTAVGFRGTTVNVSGRGRRGEKAKCIVWGGVMWGWESLPRYPRSQGDLLGRCLILGYAWHKRTRK